MTTTPAWQSRAACLDADPDLFYSTDPAQQAEARRICGNCPVRTDCLSFALESTTAGHDFGIWGGSDPRQRGRIRKGQQAPPAGPDCDDVGDVAPAVQPVVATLVEPAAPMVDVVSHPDGVYTDATGRVTVVKVDTTPRWVVLIDDRVIDRCSTLTAARVAAFDSLQGAVGAAA